MSLTKGMRDLIEFLNGFRKFIIMLILIIIAVVFLIAGYLTGAEAVDLLKGTAIAFFSFNGLEHLTNAVKEWIKRK